MKNINKIHAQIGLALFLLVMLVLLALQSRPLLQAAEHTQREAELPGDIRNAIERNQYAEEITAKEYVESGGKRFMVLNGTRNTVAGNTEYREWVRIYVNQETGYIENITVQASREKECSSDRDCIVGGNGEICTLKEVLPKLRYAGASNVSHCFSLSACGCFERHCRWKSGEAFEDCLNRGIAGELKP